MVKVPPGGREIREANPTLPRWSHATDFQNGALLTTLPGAWRDEDSTRTGGPGVSIVRCEENLGAAVKWDTSAPGRPHGEKTTLLTHICMEAERLDLPLFFKQNNPPPPPQKKKKKNPPTLLVHVLRRQTGDGDSAA